MMEEPAAQTGCYFRVDYDLHLDRFSKDCLGWWNAQEHFDRRLSPGDGWHQKATDGLKENSPIIRIGTLGDDSPFVDILILQAAKTHLRARIQLDGKPSAEALLICGVDSVVERQAIREFVETASRKPRGTPDEAELRPSRLRQRPLCLSVWLVDKNDTKATVSLNFTLQALAASYFRLKWLA